MINEYLKSGVDYKKTIYSLKILQEYFKGKGDEIEYWNKNWKNVKRNDINCSEYCFRQFLDKKLKSASQKNNVLLSLERFFDYMILMEGAKRNKVYQNPVIKKWDKFKQDHVHGTKRQAIDIDVIRKIKNILTENNFAFIKGLNQDFKDNEFNHSRSIMIYMMLTIPLRSMQVRYLDSGLGDYERYNFKTGEVEYCGGKRKEGIVQKIFYNGVSKEKKEILYIYTNKNSDGYYIPWISYKLLDLIGLQVEFIKKNFKDIKMKKEYGLKKGFDFYPLFLDWDGKIVSRESLMKLWKKLLKEYNFRYDDNVKCDLHTLRVSLITYGIGLSYDEKFIGNNWSGQTSDLVLHYTRFENLYDVVKEKQKMIENKFKFLPKN